MKRGTIVDDIQAWPSAEEYSYVGGGVLLGVVGGGVLLGVLVRRGDTAHEPLILSASTSSASYAHVEQAAEIRAKNWRRRRRRASLAMLTPHWHVCSSDIDTNLCQGMCSLLQNAFSYRMRPFSFM